MSYITINKIVEGDYVDLPFIFLVNDVEITDFEYVGYTRNLRFNFGFELTDSDFPLTFRFKIKGGYPYAFDNDTHSFEKISSRDDTQTWYYEGDESDKFIVFDLDRGIPAFWFGSIKSDLTLKEIALPSVDSYPFVHLYDIEMSELNRLTREAIINPDDLNLNLDDYIVRLNRIPFKLDSGDSVKVRLKDIETDVNALTLSESIQKIDLGSIRIPNRVHQEVGFKNIEVSLFVPFYDPIVLDSSLYLGSEIKLVLNVNVLEGTSTLNVYNSVRDHASEEIPKLDGSEWVSYVSSSKVGESIPFRIGGTADSSTDSVLNTDFIIPYVEVRTLVPDNEVDYRKLEILEIDDTKDYLKSNKPYISGKMSIREQELMKSLMSRGVLINK